MHPGWLRCSSVTYRQYAPSSRLAIRAPRPRSSTDLAIRGPLGRDSPRMVWRLAAGIRRERDALGAQVLEPLAVVICVKLPENLGVETIGGNRVAPRGCCPTRSEPRSRNQHDLHS